MRPSAPPPRGVADLSPDNLRAVLEDMGRGPGWYTSADLYAWYVSMASEDNLDPVTRKKFGATLRSLGYRSATRRVDGRHSRSWFITRRALRDTPAGTDPAAEKGQP